MAHTPLADNDESCNIVSSIRMMGVGPSRGHEVEISFPDKPSEWPLLLSYRSGWVLEYSARLLLIMTTYDMQYIKHQNDGSVLPRDVDVVVGTESYDHMMMIYSSPN